MMNKQRPSLILVGKFPTTRKGELAMSGRARSDKTRFTATDLSNLK